MSDLPPVLNGRRAGVVAHPTSLPGASIGRCAQRFARWCGEAGLHVWQVLPPGPTHGDRSPYQCQSVKAGAPDLVDRTMPLADGLDAPEPSTPHWFRAARTAFMAGVPHAEDVLGAFEIANAGWLADFALYRAIRAARDDAPWWEWPTALAERDEASLASARTSLNESIRDEVFAQFLFASQWARLREEASAHGVALFGDAPIFVAEDSADVWACRDQFLLGPDGRPEVVAGVPPDYFSPTGQRWGNPLYDWDRMEADGFAWWLERLDVELSRVDLLRIDHFRGLDAYWAVPASAPTAMVGEWRPAPGQALLAAIRERFGAVPVVAEDLGLITDSVLALRDRFALPGMKVLQFAFGGGADNPYLPHNHDVNAVVYTGTHDNDTTRGWAENADDATRNHACTYLRCAADDLPAAMRDAALASVARLAMLPMQDLLHLAGDARMNTPGVTEGNWDWRFEWAEIAPGLAASIRSDVELYGRL